MAYQREPRAAAQLTVVNGIGERSTQHHAEDLDAAAGVLAADRQTFEPSSHVVTPEVIDADRAEAFADVLSRPLLMKARLVRHIEPAGDPLVDEMAARARSLPTSRGRERRNAAYVERREA